MIAPAAGTVDSLPRKAPLSTNATGEKSHLPLTVRQKLVGTVLVLLAALATVAGCWSFLNPQPTLEQHVVVSAAQAEERYSCRGSTCVRDFNPRVEVKVVDDGVILLREVRAPAGRTFTPGQPITLYRGVLGELSISRDLPSRSFVVLELVIPVCAVTAGVFTVVARRSRRRPVTA